MVLPPGSGTSAIPHVYRLPAGGDTDGREPAEQDALSRGRGSLPRPGTKPPKRLIEALARTFGVPPAFFFDDYSDQAGLLREQIEFLALVRDARISSAEFRAILELTVRLLFVHESRRLP